MAVVGSAHRGISGSRCAHAGRGMPDAENDARSSPLLLLSLSPLCLSLYPSLALRSTGIRGADAVSTSMVGCPVAPTALHSNLQRTQVPW
jgi:hypothetical protein